MTNLATSQYLCLWLTNVIDYFPSSIIRKNKSTDTENNDTMNKQIDGH